MKFPARAEEPAHERVVEVVVHAKEQIRIVTQAVSALKENVKTGKLRQFLFVFVLENAWAIDSVSFSGMWKCGYCRG